MGTLKQQLQSDLTDAMRARDQVRTGSLRMALSAVTTEEVAGKEHRDLTDDDVLKVQPFNQMGSASEIVKSFGGRPQYLNALHTLGRELYASAVATA